MTAFKDTTNGNGEIDAGESYSFEPSGEIEIDTVPDDAIYIAPEAYDAAFDDIGHTPEEQQKIDSAPEPQVTSPTQQKKALAGLVLTVGNSFCLKLQVSPFTPEEASEWSSAAVDCMNAFNIRPADPKWAAVGVLAFTSYGIIEPRYRELKNQRPIDVAPSEDI